MKKYTLIILAALIVVIAGALWWSTTHHSAPQEAVTGYVIKSGKVYYDEHMQVQWDDNKTHDQLNEFEVADADAATFKTVPLKKGANLEADADQTMFTGITNEFGKDAKHIFFQGQELIPASSTPAIDTATFEVLGNFVKDKQGVYEVGLVAQDTQGYWLIPGVDPKTFVVVNRQYAKDAHAVYYIQNNGNNYDVLPIASLDPATFRVIGICGGAENYRSYAVADAHAVYAIDQPIPGADPATFTVVGLIDNNPDGLSSETGYAKDKNHVYKGCTAIVPGMNPTQCTAENLKGCEAQ